MGDANSCFVQRPFGGNAVNFPMSMFCAQFGCIHVMRSSKVYRIQTMLMTTLLCPKSHSFLCRFTLSTKKARYYPCCSFAFVSEKNSRRSYLCMTNSCAIQRLQVALKTNKDRILGLSREFPGSYNPTRPCRRTNSIPCPRETLAETSKFKCFAECMRSGPARF